jgi:hypothetical protein
MVAVKVAKAAKITKNFNITKLAITSTNSTRTNAITVRHDHAVHS